MKMGVMDEGCAIEEIEDLVVAADGAGSRGAAAPVSGVRESRSSAAGGSFGMYLEEIGKFALLTAAEEVELAGRVRAGDGRAREALINANLRLVVKIARDFLGSGAALEDLVQAGNIGLMEAAERFDPAFGTRFSTYAACWIKQKIRRAIEIDRTVRLPAHVHEKLRAISRARDESVRRTGREASASAVAVATGLPAEKVRRVEMAVQPVLSIDAPAFDGESGEAPSIAEAVADDRASTADEIVAGREMLAMLEQLMPNLSEREQAVLSSRFGLGGSEPMTLEEIGVAKGISRERVRQLQNAALAKLRVMLTEFTGITTARDLGSAAAAPAA
jgi:RNA polymerase primary sigma factor